MTVAAQTPSPLSADIEALVADIPGWSPTDELYSLSLLAYATAHLPGDIVEVGSWCGRSSVVLAAAARETHGIVHCIDLFPGRDDWKVNADGSYSLSVEIGGTRFSAFEQSTLWAEPYRTQVAPLFDQYPAMLDRFLATARKRRLDHLVRPHRGTSATFVRNGAGAESSFKSRLIFLDGDHSYEAVKKDIQLLTATLVAGGWICFDDAFSHYEGVDRAIGELVIESEEYDVKRQLTRKCFAARKAGRF